MRHLLVYLLWLVNCAGKTKLKQNKQKTNKFGQENKNGSHHLTQFINLLPLQNCLHNYKGYVHIIGFLCSCDITTASGIPQQKKQ